MSLPIFPVLPGLTFTVLKTPEFNTLDMKSPNGYEVRIAQTINPIWNFTLVYDFLRDYPWGSFASVSELRTMMGFFNWQSGKAGSFLFTDPDDNYVGPALNANGTPNTPLAQLQLVTDGAGNYYSPIQRTLDGNFYEDVTDLNGAITAGAVFANGLPQGIGPGGDRVNVDATLEGPGLVLPDATYMGMYLWWVGKPATPITAQFNFYFRVRFDTDSQDFEKFVNVGAAAVANAGQGGGNWTIGGSESQNGTGTLKLRTARPTPARNGS